MEKMGITVNLTSGYHPQANIQVEQANQEIGRLYTSNHEDLSRFLHLVQYAQNSLHHSATHLTPLQCDLGYQPPLFPWNVNPNDYRTIDQWFQRSEQVWQITHQCLAQATRTYKQNADHHRSEHPQYQPGDGLALD